MEQFALAREPDSIPVSFDDGRRDYIPLILRFMKERGLSQRELGLKAGIKKSRIGLLLHSDPDKRAIITLPEFQKILSALDVSMVQAIVAVEGLAEGGLFSDDRFATSLEMLSTFFQDLPTLLLKALDRIEGMDGTEVRKEWAGTLRSAVVDALVKEVGAVMNRRAMLSHIERI